MTRASLYPVAKLSSCTKKTSLCFSTPLLLWRRKMPSITGSSSSLLASPSVAAHISNESHPLMMIEPGEEDEDGRSMCRFYDYVNEKVVNTNTKIPKEVDDAICVGSSHGWLAYVSRLDCSVFLWSPFTTSPLIWLPPIHTLPFVKVIPCEELADDEHKDGDISAYDDDFSSDFGFKVEFEDQNRSQRYCTMSTKLLSLDIIQKIVLSSAPTSDDCIVVALPIYKIRHSIAFCKPGDKSWTFVEPPLEKSFHLIDVIHFNNQLFYAVSCCGLTLYAYNLSDLSSPKSYLLETSFDFEPLSSLEERMRSWYKDRYYLVESLGDLLWVRRLIANNMDDDGKFTFSHDAKIFPDQTVTFDVYKLDFSRNTWEFAKCIGDQVLFLGTNQSLSLSARDFDKLQANRIYFTDDSFTIHKKYPNYGGHDFGDYELGGSAFSEFRFRGTKILPPPFWVMRNFH
ncbi:uncharacterized protein LOC132185400 [Corylus avellana]|uniref:uncharacterized protein LOC132185400 n=1 Tax=Corylus avellana TaxID=13451 RepID=UPI00286A2539|nr:uncharacterized protein LOC132185400 [Corylus avellana]